MMHHTPHLPEGAQGESMAEPRKIGEQVNLPRPQIIEVPDEIGVCITQVTLQVRYLGWEGFM